MDSNLMPLITLAASLELAALDFIARVYRVPGGQIHLGTTAAAGESYGIDGGLCVGADGVAAAI
jgi:hypothetical protein